MDLTHEALRAGRAGAAAGALDRPAVMVAGGGGALGSEVVEQLLASRAFAPVRVLAVQPFSATVQGLEAVPLASLDAPGGVAGAPLGIVVFDRERHANGRDAAFWRPEPRELPALAAHWHRQGVRQLVVVLPHRPASLPDALKVGLANLDEQAVAALGFAHVVFVRSAQPPAAAERAGTGLQRLADLVLAQLRLMTPQPLQPVRAKKVAQLVVALARALPASAPGTRVLAPEVVWQAAQTADPRPLVRAWLAGETLPPPHILRVRM
jgi:hypothetical protein